MADQAEIESQQRAAILEQLRMVQLQLGAQSVHQSVKTFNGDPRNFREWIKSVEKFGILTQGGPDRLKVVAFQTAEGVVSDFIQRYVQENPANTWQQLKNELSSRFGEITDRGQALHVLRRLKQRGDSVQIYSEKLLTLAVNAFPGQDLHEPAIERQLIDIFIDGLSEAAVARRVLRDDPRTVHDAVESAAGEQKILRRFGLRNRGYEPRHPRSEESMEVGSYMFIW